MKIQKIILAFFLALTVHGLISSLVLAGDVGDQIDDTWLTFGFRYNYTLDDYVVYGCNPADPNGLPCQIPIGAIPAEAPPWTFTAPEHGVMFTVVDLLSSGEQFQILDFDVPIGITSAPLTGYCGNYPDICLSNPAISSGAFFLEAGDHSITFAVVIAPYTVGTACFRLESATPGLMPILDLIEAVKNLALEGKLGDNQATALVNLLEKSLDKLDVLKMSSGCSKLEDFAFEVTNLIDNDVLSSVDGEPLIDAVDQIQESLDCLSYQEE